MGEFVGGVAGDGDLEPMGLDVIRDVEDINGVKLDGDADVVVVEGEGGEDGITERWMNCLLQSIQYWMWWVGFERSSLSLGWKTNRL